MRFPISRKNFAPAIIENCVVYLRRVVGFLFVPPTHNPKWVFPTTQQHMQATFGAFALLLCRKMRNAGCPGSLRGVLRRVPSKHPLVERVESSFYSIHIVHVQLEVPLKQPLFIKVYWEISFMFFKKYRTIGKYLLRLRNFFLFCLS